MSDVKYFQTTKKGEIRELRDDLNSTNREKIKEAVKKIIAAMTVGKDVSMLFTDVIKSMGTDNIELKKLIYLYIINYARSQPEKAILVVSMFCKDVTNHPNPLVRALALRTMGCIRVDRITEYLCDPLAYALKDVDPYVRKTAAICVAKFYDLNPELVRDRGFIDSLRNLLSDTNPMVVSNAVASLTEICESSGIDYFKIDNNTLSKLLTALNQCTEWGRVFIMEALSKFEAKGQQAHDICQRIIPQLAHSNSAVVMGAVKIIIKFMAKLSNSKEQEKYCKKLAPPLLFLISAPPEIQYVALRNIDLIVQKYPQIFAKDIRIFYVKYNDESYVKKQKLEILVKLATVKNVKIILQEFEQYAQEIDIDFVRRSVRGIGRIAIKSGLEIVSQECVETLSKLIKTKVNYIVQECVIVIKDIFRRYPGKYEKIIVTLCDNLHDLTEPKAKASMIWIIGEYAERIMDANERLNSFSESFESESDAVQLQLLTASVKLFLKKPDIGKTLVQKVLHLATEASDNPDLRDRGYVYWRLLSTDPSAARKVVLAERPIISFNSIDHLSKDYLSTLLNNLSTLSSVYHCKPNEFVENNKNVSFRQWQNDSDNDSDSDIDPGYSSSPTPSPSPSKSPEPEVKQNNDINIMDGLFENKNRADLTLAFDANRGDGLEMSIGFKAGKQMVIQCINKGNDMINRIDIKFNKNYLGIQPTQTVPLNGDIKPGQSQIVNVPLILVQEPVIKQLLDFNDFNVQIAARCVRTNVLKQSKPPKIVMFASNIPAQIFFSDSMVKDKQEFLCKWKSVSVENEDIIKRIFEKNKDINVVNIKEIFSNNSFVFITERQVQNRGVSLYFTTLLKDVTILLELSIANNEKCRIVTKSRNKYLSNIVCDVGVSLIEKQ